MEPPLQTSKDLGKARRSPERTKARSRGPQARENGSGERMRHQQREGLSQDSDATATLHRLRVPQGAGSRESSLCPRWTGLWGGGMGRFLFPSHAPRYDVKLACQLPSPPLFPQTHTRTPLRPTLSPRAHTTRAPVPRARGLLGRVLSQRLSAGRPAAAGGAVRLRCRRCRRGSSSTWWLGVSFPTPSTARLRPCARCTA